MNYSSNEPARADVDATTGPAVIEFGSNTCGYCRAAQPLITEAFAGHANVRHIKVEDGKGRPLGRSYRVKLWPTLVFLKDGQEVARVVRPTDVASIRSGLARSIRD
ncbi:MAG: thioredoxin family protein [Betaproteobacteria bacterium]